LQIIGSYLQMFYNDEHALTLGMRQLLNGTATIDYGFTTFNPPTGYTAYCVSNPGVGQTVRESCALT
jgi:hypothetical protein